MPEDETPQVAPNLFKKVGGWVFVALMIAPPIVLVFQETRNGRRLDKLALKILEHELGHEAESAIEHDAPDAKEPGTEL